MRHSVALIALTALAACLALAQAQTAPAPAKTCKTALDLIAAQNMNLPVHPVFQNILNSPDLKGTIFIPTTKAWDQFFTTMRQRQGNPAAPAMIARYGQILLYHLAKDVQVPIADATPGANKFAVDTASTLQCTFGPGLPNNRMIIKKTPQAIYVQHGTGNATIVSQKMDYCGGEAYLVDQVLNPCSDISAIMAEVANIPNPCKTNVEGVLNRNDLSYFNALLLATGVQRPVFSSVRNFTVFAPSNDAIINAFKSGAFNYPYLYTNNLTTLEGIVAYHVVPQYQFAGPSKQTLNMKTLLTEGTGEAKCTGPSLSWRPDNIVYGGTGNGKVSAKSDRGCNTQVRIIDAVLQPCCKPMAELISGPSGLLQKAPKGSIQEGAYRFLLNKVATGAAGTTFIMPSADAWAQFEADAAKQRVNLTDDKLDALFAYLLTAQPTAQSLTSGAPVPTALGSRGYTKTVSRLCPKGTKANIVYATDTSSSLSATSDVATASRAPAAAPAAYGAAAPAGYPAGAGAGAAGYGAGAGAAGYGAGAGAAGYGAGAAAAPAAGAGYPAGAGYGGAAAAPASAYGKLRRSLMQALGMGAADVADPSVSSDLILPTAFTPKADPTVGGPAGTAAAAGPITLVDGQEMELKAGLGIPVTSMTYSCDGTIYNTDAVPLPCNVLNRTVVYPSPPPPPMAALLPPTAAPDAMNETSAAAVASNSTGMAPTNAAAAAAPLAGSLLAAVLFAALLL